MTFPMFLLPAFLQEKARNHPMTLVTARVRGQLLQRIHWVKRARFSPFAVFCSRGCLRSRLFDCFSLAPLSSSEKQEERKSLCVSGLHLLLAEFNARSAVIKTRRTPLSAKCATLRPRTWPVCSALPALLACPPCRVLLALLACRRRRALRVPPRLRASKAF